jgi:phosphatidate cytidylyltransferase
LSNLQLRLVTAVVGLPIVVGAVWLGGWYFASLAALVAFLGAIEFLHGWLYPDRPVASALRLWAVPVSVAGVVLLAHWEARLAMMALLLALLCAAVGYAPVPSRINVLPYRVFSWCLAYVGFLLAAGVLLRDLDQGRPLVFLAILGTFATDTGAYAVGRLVGRRPLAPTISPKKTVEGAVGGFLFGAVVVALLATLQDLETVSTGVVVVLALGLPLAAQIGDLVESWMKRMMGVKDSSSLLPGHGGILDRMDSIVLTLPFTYVVVNWLDF